MLKSYKFLKSLLVIFLFFVLFFGTTHIGNANRAYAQTCSGNALCIPLQTSCSPSGCIPGSPGCVCSLDCPNGVGGMYIGVGCGGSTCSPLCPSGYGNCSASNNCVAGGGGGGSCSDVGVGCSSNGECCSGRCSASRGICVNPGGGGGVECGPATNCPPGTIRGSTVVSTVEEWMQCFPPIPGTAQISGACSDWYTPPRVCGPWYNCPTPSNPGKMCRDCTDDPGWCRRYFVDTYNCVSTCSATAPTNITFTPISLTSARLNWTPGTGGTTQYVYLGTNRADVEANCASGTCAVSTNLGSATQSSYTTPQVLTPGSVYYYRVTNSESISCSTPSATGTSMISCSLSPTSLALSPGQSSTITASIANSPEIQRVDFASNSPSIASVNPASDNTYPYTTTVTANAVGSVNIQAAVYYTNGSVACQTTIGGSGAGGTPGSQSTTVNVINSSCHPLTDFLDFSLKTLTLPSPSGRGGSRPDEKPSKSG